MKLRTALLSLAVVGSAMGAASAADGVNLIYKTRFNSGEVISKTSDNGLWSVAYTPLAENPQYNTGAKLINLSEGKTTSLTNNKQNSCTASDVSDDGSIVVGASGTGVTMERQAFYKDGSWSYLPYPDDGKRWEGGRVNAVTPDGKYAVGVVYNYSGVEVGDDGIPNYGEAGVLWDIENKTVIATPNMPTVNLDGVAIRMIRFTDISADGSKIIGHADFSYLGSNFSFVYDVKNDSWMPIGFEYEDGTYRATVGSLEHTEDAIFSPNGQYVLCDGYFVADPQTLGGVEYYAPFLYSYATQQYTVFDGEEYQSSRAGAVDNDGNVYISTPYDSPLRKWYVRSGKYWVSCEQLLSQIYNTDIDRLTGYMGDCNSGTLLGIDNSGRRLSAFIDSQSGQSYVIEFPESPALLGANINLLDMYVATPADGSTLTSVRDFEIRFDRNVEVAGNYSDIALLDASGNVFKNAIKCEVSPSNQKVVNISFRKVSLDDGKKYTLSIPAGMFNVQGDKEAKSGKIEFTYNGRAEKPVQLQTVDPADGSQLARFNMSGDPIRLVFDINVKVSPEAQGSFNAVLEDGSLDMLSPLGIMYGGNTVQIYPQNDQVLYKGNKYRIVIAAGSITDVQGECGNEEIVLNYEGLYEDAIVETGPYIFRDNFNDGLWLNNFMFRDGDGNQPTAEMQSWGFENGEQYPWWIVRDDNDAENWSLASHSMYSPAGKSDDWIVLRRKMIPDESTYLEFLSQSYKKGKEDRLKVYVLATDVIHNYLNEQFVEEIRTKGDLVYDEVQSPGASEEKLAGEWKENVVPLGKYAGKNVYIAVVNDNENQSAVFIDDFALVHNVSLIVTLDTPETAVAKNSVAIKGRVSVENAEDVYNDLQLVLVDGSDKEISKINETGLNLKKGDVYNFQFPKELPLKRGKTNGYKVKVKSGEVEMSTSGSISNLYFQPTKRVVLEEGTGQACQNCPMGHEMIEKLKAAYGDRFIPAAFHTYTGDNLASGMNGYTSFLGITGYPSAVVNRRNDGQSFQVVYPMSSDANGYKYSDPENPMWWDVVAEEMQIGTTLNVDFKSWDGQITTPLYSTTDSKFYIPLTLTYAMDSENLNYNVQCLILEDHLTGYQVNGLCTNPDPIFGEWGQGGKYAKPMVDFEFDHVVRAMSATGYNGQSGMLEKNVEGGRPYFTELYLDVPGTVEVPENCSVIAMIIDATTGHVVNANCAHFVASSGVDGMESEVSAPVIYAEGGDVVVEGTGMVEVQAYSLSGQLVAAGNGENGVRLHTSGYSGVLIVRGTANGMTTTAKVMTK